MHRSLVHGIFSCNKTQFAAIHIVKLGYGQDGPYKSYPGYDVVIEAEAGLMHMLVSGCYCEDKLIPTMVPSLAQANLDVNPAKSESQQRISPLVGRPTYHASPG